MTDLVSPLDFGAPYAHDLIAEVEDTSCSLGCAHAIDPSPDTPGGGCHNLMACFLAEPVPFRWGLDDHGHRRVVCDARQDPDGPRTCDGQEVLPL